MVILGIDYGEKWLGMALSVEGVIETVKSQIPSTKFKINPKHQIQNSKLKIIRQVCGENQVDKIVVGLPKGRLKKKIMDFGHKLKNDLSLPVELWDESLSSKEAVATMIQSGISRKKRKEKEHSVAAAVILRDYLQSRQ